MENEFYTAFLESAEKAIAEGCAPRSFQLKNNPLPDSVCNGHTLDRFRSALSKSIENLDEELSRFEKMFSSKHNAVFWASDYNDVFESLKKLLKLHKIKSVRLPNINASTVFRELGIKYFLRDQKIELSDEGDMQFFVADMMFSDTGSLLLLNQTNKGLERLTNNKINVFFATIDCIVGNSDWAEVFQQLTSYNTGCGSQDMLVFRGSANCNNYLFIIDNQRTNLLQFKDLRQSLTCLNCGRCSDVCPVYQTIGDEPYNNVFAGPVANITLPYLETVESYRHVAYACTLCGRCEEVCPISLPVRDMIVDSRQVLLANDGVDKNDRRRLAAIRKFSSNRKKMNGYNLLKRHVLLKYLSSDYRKSHRLIPFSKETFNKSYKKFTENGKGFPEAGV